MKKKFVPAYSLCISLFVTFILWSTVNNLEIQKDQLEFDRFTDRTKHSIEEKLHQANDIINGARGFFTASELVEPSEWTKFVDAQNIKERFPGIQGLGLIKHLENEEEIDELVQFMNSYGIMDFHVTPEGKRDKYYVVTYLEPHDFRNLRAIGYDIYSEPTRRQAAEIAEVTGKTTITGKIILIQETDKDIQSGFLMLQPVYDNKTSNHTMTESKENIAGFVYASFRIKDLMNATLEPLLLQNINLKIYDGSEEPQNLFFTNEFAFNPTDIIETKTDVIQFGERTWTLVFENSKPSYFNSMLSNIILFAGFLMSILLFFIFYFINKNMALMQEKIKTEKFSIIGELSARLSHDLRNPLNVIKLSIQLLELENKEKLDSTSKKRIESINRAVDRIAHQVDDVLGFVRIKALSLESVSLMSILESTLEDIKIPDKIKIIKPESDITLSVDSKQMGTVFSNIIINAIQAIDESGKIEIRFVESSNHVKIQFIDSGPGIPPENLEKIFDPLFTTKQVGTGLGLSSCKTIIEKHGGTISVENNPTTFTVRLPKMIKS